MVSMDGRGGTIRPRGGETAYGTTVSPRFTAAALLDLLDGHDEEAADDGQCDGRREREVVAEVDHDGGHDDRAAHLAEGGGHVQDAQILAGLFLVR